eukprot:7109458-Lingulodinium_polyedra.AAC.1
MATETVEMNDAACYLAWHAGYASGCRVWNFVVRLGVWSLRWDDSHGAMWATLEKTIEPIPLFDPY